MTEPRASEPRWSVEARDAVMEALAWVTGTEVAAENALDALADLGLLAEFGGDVREEWRVNLAGESWERIYPTEADADQHLRTEEENPSA